MSSPPLSVFVYYRVPRARWSEAALAVNVLQQAMRMRNPGLQTRLLRRADDDTSARAASEQTWMEVYEHADGGVSPACLTLMRELVSSWPDGLTSERHIECFQPLQDAASAASA